MTVRVRRGVDWLPAAPTPMTWAVLQTLLGATGGTGLMLADLGAPPDPILGDAGAYDLVAGRPVLNLERDALMRGADAPFRYPIDELRAAPELALTAEPVLSLPRGLAGFARLPRAAWRLYRMDAVPRALLPTFAGPFAARTLPTFVTSAKVALAEDLAGRSGEQLLARLRDWRLRAFAEFGRAALKPARLAGAARRAAIRLLAPKLGRGRAAAAVDELEADVPVPPAHDLAGDLLKLRRGELGVATLVARFGHRAADDLELGCPRYAERPDALPPHPPPRGDFADLEARLGRLAAPAISPEADPEAFARVVAQARFTGPYRDRLARTVAQMRGYSGLDVAARDGLAAGAAVLRQTLLAIGGVTGLGDDVFELLPEELPGAFAGVDLAGRARGRKAVRLAELRAELPAVVVG